MPDASAPSLPVVNVNVAAEAASSSKPVRANCPAADAPPAVTVPGDAWSQLKARPKALVSSTPSHKEWSVVGVRSRNRRPSSYASLQYKIHPENNYHTQEPYYFPLWLRSPIHMLPSYPDKEVT